MTQPTPAPANICPGCDGFASVAITLGGRTRTGARRTITAHCHTCHGTGTAPNLRALLHTAATAVFTHR
ncbi:MULTISPECIES: hypothetical protein [unclassified Streptomyces]|uniref:hypothetical protein n=1 Tax=unclassified Streptomyces TaxID=2593676 RepID=UPI002DDB0586|nr:hypothetical protein [Streptomyces sp. NBC_01766]WSC20987.1 hypothetical protein OIE60_15590 [Streptomyces sp. NBC_01766]